MHRSSCAVAALVLLGCASGSAGGPSAAPTTQTISVPRDGPIGREDGVLTLTRTNRLAVDEVPVGPAATLAALRRAYAAVGVPVTLDEPATGRVGNPKHVLRRALNGTVLSEYLQCGSTLTGERATNDRIIMSLVSTVRLLSEGRSSVGTQLSATAVDISGSSTDPQLCTSTGVLEMRVNAHVKAAAAEP